MIRLMRALPYGAMLLVAVAPYKAWAFFGGSYALWDAHRAAFVAVLVVALAALGLQRLGYTPAKASVAAAILALGVLLTQVHPFIPLVIGSVALLAAIVDRSRAYENASLVLMVAGAVLFYGAVSPAVQFQTAERAVVDVAPEFPDLGDLTLRETPSIVHIVLDGYGASETLADIYQHDTGPFFGALQERGFVVIEDAVTPYSQTLPSMASVLSGAPVDMGADGRAPIRLRGDLAHTIRHGPVPATLEAAGYTFARAESGYAFVDFGGAQRVTGDGLALSPLDTYLLRGAGNYFGAIHNDMLLEALAPGTLAELPQPFFYYQHLIAPHPPFTLAADGSPRESESYSYFDGSHLIAGSAERRDAYKVGYREKALFIEGALLRQLDALPEGPRIVVIHGDHGPGAYLDQESPALTCMGERLRTFVAVYSDVPGVTEALAAYEAPGFSTVNVYRAILSALSGETLPFVEAEPRHLLWSDPSAMQSVSRAELEAPCAPVLNAAVAQ